jgi:YgiT-type zinc finger domain-containing protein
MMRAICRNGELRPGEATFTLDRNGQTFLLCNVAALVWDRCGEASFDEDVTTRIFEAVAAGAIVSGTPRDGDRW